MRAPVLFVAAAGLLLGGCLCMRARFDDTDRAAPALPDAVIKLAPKCEQWFVRECTAGAQNAVWLFKPRIDGPAETAAYDRANGALLYERQFGTSGGWAFTPVRQYGRAPACRPALDTTGAEKLCDWIERGAAGTGATATPTAATPAPAETKTAPVPSPEQTPSPSLTPQ